MSPFYGFGFQYRAIPIVEGYSIFILFVDCIYRQGRLYVCERLIPAGEGVALACGVSGSRGILAPFHFLGLQHRTIPVTESYGIFNLFVDCIYCQVRLYVRKRLVPAGKGITLTCRSCRSCGCLSIFNFLSLQYRTIPIVEGHGKFSIRFDDTEVVRCSPVDITTYATSTNCQRTISYHYSQRIFCWCSLSYLYLLVFSKDIDSLRNYRCITLIFGVGQRTHHISTIGNILCL